MADRDDRTRRGGREAVVHCASCGRRMEWRAAWALAWPDVRWCSDACRRRRVRPIDKALERSIRGLLAERREGATVCPSEAARAVAGEHTLPGEGWRTLIEPARAAARRLVVAGEVDVVQRGRVVDASTARGAIRVRRRPGVTPTPALNRRR